MQKEDPQVIKNPGGYFRACCEKNWIPTTKNVQEKKLSQAVGNYFQQLRDRATIDNFVTGTTQSPKLGPARPQPAARPVDLNGVLR